MAIAGVSVGGSRVAVFICTPARVAVTPVTSRVSIASPGMAVTPRVAIPRSIHVIKAIILCLPLVLAPRGYQNAGRVPQTEKEITNYSRQVKCFYQSIKYTCRNPGSNIPDLH